MPKIHRTTIKKQKEEFLSKLTENKGIVYTTCQAQRISYHTYLKWFKEDEDFRKKVEMEQENQVDYIESKLMELVDLLNPTAIIFALKSRRPAKWNDKAGQQININITGTEFQIGGNTLEDVKFIDMTENKMLEEGEDENK